MNSIWNKPIPVAIVTAIYFMLSAIFHEEIGGAFARLFSTVPVLGSRLLILTLFSVAALLAIAVLHSHTSDTKQWLIASFIQLCLSAAAYALLIINDIEVIHFIQYAILYLLLFLFLQNTNKALFWTFILGMLDESFQYFVLAPEKYKYFDFNDTVLNLIGGGFGWLIVQNTALVYWEKRKDWKFEIVFIGIALLSIAVLMHYELFKVYAANRRDDTMILLYKIKLNSFWRTTNNGQYHVLRFIEWAVVVGILFLYYGLTRQKATNPSRSPK